MQNEFEYLFTPNVEIEYLFKDITKEQWNKVLQYFSLKYSQHKTTYEYVDTFYDNDIRHNKYETIQKQKLCSYYYSNNIKCNINKEIQIFDFNEEKHKKISFRKKNKTVFSFKYYSLELSKVTADHNKDSYEIELELDIHRCRLESLETLQSLIKRDLDNFIKSLLH